MPFPSKVSIEFSDALEEFFFRAYRKIQMPVIVMVRSQTYGGLLICQLLDRYAYMHARPSNPTSHSKLNLWTFRCTWLRGKESQGPYHTARRLCTPSISSPLSGFAKRRRRSHRNPTRPAPSPHPNHFRSSLSGRWRPDPDRRHHILR